VQPTPPDEPQQPDIFERTETVADDDPAPRVGWRGSRVWVAAAAVVALLAAGAFGFALASSGSDDVQQIAVGTSGSTESDSDDDGDGGLGDTMRDKLRGWAEDHRGGPMMRGPMMRGGFGLGGPMAGLALHGEFVVPDGDGGYQTVVSQRGKVTAVSDTSLSVRSSDGFTATYQLTDDTVVLAGTDGTDDIAKGAQVAVTAMKSGGTSTAVHVVDLSQLQERFRQHLDDLPGLPDGDAPEPSQTATSGASA
jgi:hypothetical protein